MAGPLHLEVLPPRQRALWARLGEVPSEFVLYGGTAIALRLGHRQSLDFDFFAPRDFDPATLRARIPFLEGAETVQVAPSTLLCRTGGIDGVLVGFFGLPRLKRVAEPDLLAEPAVRIAALIDLAGTKAAVVQRRAAAKDYLDLDALIASGIGLPTALAAAKTIYGDTFNPLPTLKALCFFGDGDLGSVPFDARERLARAVKQTDLDRLPTIAAREDGA
jgi:hypothetical protein